AVAGTAWRTLSVRPRAKIREQIMRAVRWIALASALLLSQLSLPLPESWSLSVAAADSQLPTAEHAGVGYQLEDAGAASFDERLTRLESLLTQPRYVS